MHVIYTFSLKAGKYFLVVVSVGAVVLFVYPVSVTFGGMAGFSKNLIFFISGILFQKKYLSGKAGGRSSYPMPFAVASVLFFLLCGGFTFYLTKTPIFVVSFLLGLFGIAAIVLVSNVLAEERVVLWMEYIGLYSMPIYLVHAIAGNGLVVVLDKLLGV